MQNTKNEFVAKKTNPYLFLSQTNIYANSELFYSIVLISLLFIYNFPLYTFIQYELGGFGMLRILYQYLSAFYILNFAFFLLLAYSAKRVEKIKKRNTSDGISDPISLVFTILFASNASLAVVFFGALVFLFIQPLTFEIAYQLILLPKLSLTSFIVSPTLQIIIIIALVTKSLAVVYYGILIRRRSISFPNMINKRKQLLLMIGGLLFIIPQLTFLAALLIALTIADLCEELSKF